MKGLVSAGELRVGPDAFFLKALGSATAAWNSAGRRAAIRWLQYFIVRVRFVIANRAEYTPLIDEAQNIISAIGG